MCLSKVNSFKELQNLYSNLKGLLDIKKGKPNNDKKMNISICGGTGCQASQSEKIKEELTKREFFILCNKLNSKLLLTN